MNLKIKKLLPILEYVVQLKDNPRQKFLTKLNENVLKNIIDLIYNIYIKTISIKPEVVDKLRKYKKYFKSICEPKLAFNKRRQQLLKNKVFFKTIFPLILPQLIAYVTPKSSPKLTSKPPTGQNDQPIDEKPPEQNAQILAANE